MKRKTSLEKSNLFSLLRSMLVQKKIGIVLNEIDDLLVIYQLVLEIIRHMMSDHFKLFFIEIVV